MCGRGTLATCGTDWIVDCNMNRAYYAYGACPEAIRVDGGGWPYLCPDGSRPDCRDLIFCETGGLFFTGPDAPDWP